MLRKKIDDLKVKYAFKFSIIKLKLNHNKLVRTRLKILKFCLKNISKYNIYLANENELDFLKKLLGLYDETIEELNKDLERYRECLE